MNNNHFLVTLHSSKEGYVTKCTSCDHVQFLIGNLYTHMPLKSFIVLKESFERILAQKDLHEHETPHGLRLKMTSPIDGVFLSFTEEELTGVIDLFEKALIGIEINDILGSTEAL